MDELYVHMYVCLCTCMCPWVACFIICYDDVHVHTERGSWDCMYTCMYIYMHTCTYLASGADLMKVGAILEITVHLS